MVRNYKDVDLLDRVKKLVNFNYIPFNYWILGVRAKADEADKFDCKFYLYNGDKFVMVTTGTTTKGLKGTAIMKADIWNYDAYMYGLHRGKMKALRQVKPIPYYRDYVMDGINVISGPEHRDIIYMNIHGATYNNGSKQIATRVKGWSEGCQVMNKNEDYERMIQIVAPQKIVTYCLINEF